MKRNRNPANIAGFDFHEHGAEPDPFEENRAIALREDRFNVSFFLLPGFSLISFSAAIEPLRIANKVLGDGFFHYLCSSTDGAAVIASCGVAVNAGKRIEDVAETDLLVVCSSDGVETHELQAGPRQAIRKLFHSGTRIAGVCTGAYVLAGLGLLHDRTCTIHWEYADLFREKFPRSDLVDDIYREDGRILTCAGGDATFDMMMKLIEDECGGAVIGSVLDIALHNRARSSSFNQRGYISDRLGVYNQTLIACIDQMEKHIENPIELSELAIILGKSRRNIERLFKTHLGTTPKTYYRRLRLEVAKRLIERSDQQIFDIAVLHGFESASHFSKCFREEFGACPTEHRRKFQLAQNGAMLTA